MDLFDFAGTEQDNLYFEEDLTDTVKQLLATAANQYADDDESAELFLLRAFFLAPRSLSVLVALYRYYYYQHRYAEVLTTAEHALIVSGDSLGLPRDWRVLQPQDFGKHSMSLVRFYLLALKGMAYVKLRLDELDEGEQILDKILLLDPEDRLGASVLKQVLIEQKQQPRLVVSNKNRI